MKWVMLVRVWKKIKTQSQNPPRETTTWRVPGGGGWYKSDSRVIP